MNLDVVYPPPVPTPEPSIVITLTLEEATYLEDAITPTKLLGGVRPEILSLKKRLREILHVSLSAQGRTLSEVKHWITMAETKPRKKVVK